jgi:dipeptide/tripeptide permease
VTEQKPGFIATVKSYPSAFWVANTMEIFERMAWYGFYAVSSLYITGPVETGGLGFTSEERGQLQAIVPFFLYLFPVLTGALADRYGYKRMFIIAYVGMIISYFALGQFKTFPTFLAAFMMVAVAAAIFKPVVVGTVARVTNEGNSAMAFGIFYMMVNIGGFVGPIIAGVVRGIAWKYVFIACAGWAAINLLIALLFYREPTTESASAERRSLRTVLDNAVEVLGNLRFFICVFIVLIALMIANQEFDWFSWWPHCTLFVPGWIIVNLFWDALVGEKKGERPAGPRRPWFLRRMHCSNWRFALFLLIMSGFWTSFNQIFITLPEYIRDFADTKPMVNVGRTVFGAIGKPEWIKGLASIEETELMAKFDATVRRARNVPTLSFPGKDPTVKSVRSDIRQTISALKRMKDRTWVPEARKDEIAAKIKQARAELDDDLENLTALNDKLAAFKKTVQTEIDEAAYPTEPSMTDDDRAELAALVAQINAGGTDKPFKPAEFVAMARKFLEYKVRLTPVEIAEAVLMVPAATDAPADELLDVAIETINTRMDLDGKNALTKAQTAVAREMMAEAVAASGPMVSTNAVQAIATAVTAAVEAEDENGNPIKAEDQKVKPKIIASGIRDLVYRPVIWERVDANRQVNPEHIVNIDALSIICLQVLVSFLMARFHQFTTMIVGMLIAAVGIGLPMFCGGTMVGPIGGLLIVVIVGIVIFAIGEMMASPTSQEYVGRIAPRDKVALYMGYYFVAVALGNLFGGILSGQLYGKLARDAQRPDLMWAAFGGLMIATALIFLLYNKFALPKHQSDTLTQ